jgi:DNA ligase-1
MAQKSIASFFTKKPDAIAGKKRKVEEIEPESPTEARALKRLKKNEEESEDKNDLDELLDEKENENINTININNNVVTASPTKPLSPKSENTTTPGSGIIGARDSYTLHEVSKLWKPDEPVPFLALARTFCEIQKIRARLMQIELLRDFLICVIVQNSTDLIGCVSLASNQLFPPYEGVELGLGESIIIKAIIEATGRSKQMITADYKKLGDLGLVAQACGHNVRTLVPPKPLTVQNVVASLKAIAKEQGQASVRKKQDRVRQLLVSSRESEAQFIVRLLQGKIRINMGPKTVVAALAHALAFVEKKKPTKEELAEAVSCVQGAYNCLPNWEKIVPVALKEGVWNLPKHIHLTLGIPVEPMLAQPSKDIGQVLERLQGKKFTCEYKYDGERTQIHKMADGTVKIFSRNLEDTTPKFPDILNFLPKVTKEGVTSFILDCEAVAFDRVTNKIRTFQVLSTRARKEVKLEDIKVDVCLQAFDLLYLNGESLITEELHARRERLYESFQEVQGTFMFVQKRDLEEVEEIQAYLNEAVENQTEGLMVKTLEGPDSCYEIAKRSYNWLKLKKDYLNGMTDTLDLVPIGAWYGKGKRTGLFGAFLLACYDEEGEEFQSVCKTGTGFSDAMFDQLTKSLQDHIIADKPNYYRLGDSLKPDVWFSAAQVWEVRAADLSLSPVHMGGVGLISEVKGIGLRFPRFIRVRDDKAPEQATSGAQVADMYRNQKVNFENEDGADEDD